jgi:Flp pilus assembly pilin Flp
MLGERRRAVATSARSRGAAVGMMLRFIRDEGGVTSIDYALVVAEVAMVIVAVLGYVGHKLKARFDDIANNLVAS